MQPLNDQPQLVGLGVGGETVRITLEPVASEEMSRVWTLFPNAELPHLGRLPRLSGLDRSGSGADRRSAGDSRAAPGRSLRERRRLMALNPGSRHFGHAGSSGAARGRADRSGNAGHRLPRRARARDRSHREADRQPLGPVRLAARRFAWPEAIDVDTGSCRSCRTWRRRRGLPTSPRRALKQRRMRIWLRPTTAYRSKKGSRRCVDASSRLRRPGRRDGRGARVQLAWRDELGNWSPPPPAPENLGPGTPPSPTGTGNNRGRRVPGVSEPQTGSRPEARR